MVLNRFRREARFPSASVRPRRVLRVGLRNLNVDVRPVPLSLVRRSGSLIKYRKPQLAHLIYECVDLLARVVPSPDVDCLAFVVRAIGIMHAIDIVSHMEAARFCSVAKIAVIFEVRRSAGL